MNSGDVWRWWCSACGIESTVIGLDNALDEAEAHSLAMNAMVMADEEHHVVSLGPGENYDDTVARILTEAEEIIRSVW